MRFAIRGRHIQLTEALLAHVERRLRFALGRFGPKIRQVAVKLTDLNGPRGGLDKQCQIAVTLSPSGKVRAEATDADLHTAIDLVSERLERAVARELERRRET
jgi:ribosomal subunit interface protein